MSYYYPPQPRGAEEHINLHKGLDTFRMLDDTRDDHLTGLLTAIIGLEKKQNAKTNAHYIAYRGMMTNVSMLSQANMSRLTLTHAAAHHALRSH